MSPYSRPMRALRRFGLLSLALGALLVTASSVGIAFPVTPPASVGLPTHAETAAAKHALALGVETITKFSGLHCVGPHFKLLPGQTRTGYLIANPGQLECNILADTRYRIKVVSASPKPFYKGKEGELSATFAPQAGFILLYTTAGKLGIPYSHEIKVAKTS